MYGYRGPSVKAMVQRLKIPVPVARKIKMAMEDARPRAALALADRAMDGSGVESLYPDYPYFYYVNMGETYATTLCFTGSSFYIGSWGDWVERHRPVETDGSNPVDPKYWRGGKRPVRRRCR